MVTNLGTTSSASDVINLERYGFTNRGQVSVSGQGNVFIFMRSQQGSNPEVYVRPQDLNDAEQLKRSGQDDQVQLVDRFGVSQGSSEDRLRFERQQAIDQELSTQQSEESPLRQRFRQSGVTRITPQSQTPYDINSPEGFDLPSARELGGTVQQTPRPTLSDYELQQTPVNVQFEQGVQTTFSPGFTRKQSLSFDEELQREQERFAQFSTGGKVQTTQTKEEKQLLREFGFSTSKGSRLQRKNAATQNFIDKQIVSVLPSALPKYLNVLNFIERTDKVAKQQQEQLSNRILNSVSYLSGSDPGRDILSPKDEFSGVDYSGRVIKALAYGARSIVKGGAKISLLSIGKGSVESAIQDQDVQTAALTGGLIIAGAAGGIPLIAARVAGVGLTVPSIKEFATTQSPESLAGIIPLAAFEGAGFLKTVKAGASPLARVISFEQLKSRVRKADKLLVKEYGESSKEVLSFREEYDLAFNKLPRLAKPLRQISVENIEATVKNKLSPQTISKLNAVVSNYQPYIIGSKLFDVYTNIKSPPRKVYGDLDIQQTLFKGEEKALARELQQVLVEAPELRGVNVPAKFGTKYGTSQGTKRFVNVLQGEEFINIGNKKSYFQETQIPQLLRFYESPSLTFVEAPGGAGRYGSFADQLRKKFEVGYLQGNVVKSLEAAKGIKSGKVKGSDLPSGVYRGAKNIIDVGAAPKALKQFFEDGRFIGKTFTAREVISFKLKETRVVQNLDKYSNKLLASLLNVKVKNTLGVIPEYERAVKRKSIPYGYGVGATLYDKPVTTGYEINYPKTPSRTNYPNVPKTNYPKVPTPTEYRIPFPTTYTPVPPPSYPKTPSRTNYPNVPTIRLPSLTTYYPSDDFTRIIVPPPKKSKLKFDDSPFRRDPKQSKLLDRLTKYQPSLVGVQFKYRQPKIPKYLTGLEIRGVR